MDPRRPRSAPGRPSSSSTSPSTTTSRAKGAGGGQRPVADRAGRQDLRPRRPVRLRQDDDAQDGQPADRADERPDPDRRVDTATRGRHRAAAGHRLRHPAGRPLPAPDDRRERRSSCRACSAGRKTANRSGPTSLLTLVGLDPARYRDRYPSQLSGGERQRVGVARALAADPPIMLMDEPFGAVDPIVRERLQNEFLRLQEELAKTILFVTHDIDEAIKMGDLVAVMEVGGRLAQFAPPAEILASPASEFVARFVGADRGLKRLSLSRVGDLELQPAATARVGDDAAAARRRDPRRSVRLSPARRREEPPAGLDRPGRDPDRRPPDRIDGPVDVAADQPTDDAQGRPVDAARRRRPGGHRGRPEGRRPRSRDRGHDRRADARDGRRRALRPTRERGGDGGRRVGGGRGAASGPGRGERTGRRRRGHA